LPLELSQLFARLTFRQFVRRCDMKPSKEYIPDESRLCKTPQSLRDREEKFWFVLSSGQAVNMLGHGRFDLVFVDAIHDSEHVVRF
jgi:hypothetical protein